MLKMFWAMVILKYFEYNMQFSMSFRFSLCFHNPEISTG